jgi:hypothetical protein
MPSAMRNVTFWVRGSNEEDILTMVLLCERLVRTGCLTKLSRYGRS